MIGNEEVESSILSRSTSIPSDLTAGSVEAANLVTVAVTVCGVAEGIVPT
jgi:hypothetical protein